MLEIWARSAPRCCRSSTAAPPTERLARPRTSDGRVQEATQLRANRGVSAGPLARRMVRHQCGGVLGPAAGVRRACSTTVMIIWLPPSRCPNSSQLNSSRAISSPTGWGTRGARGTPQLAAGSGNGDPSSSVSPSADCSFVRPLPGHDQPGGDQGCSASAARGEPTACDSPCRANRHGRVVPMPPTRTRSTCRAEVPHRDCLSETESGPTHLCHRGGH